LVEKELARLENAVQRSSARVCVVEDPERDRYEISVEEDVMLTDPSSDAKRFAWLVHRVITDADAIEYALAPEFDATLEDVRSALGRRGRVVGEGDAAN
jgi:hypothetical protein